MYMNRVQKSDKTINTKIHRITHVRFVCRRAVQRVERMFITLGTRSDDDNNNNNNNI